jgi:hypothetical protein
MTDAIAASGAGAYDLSDARQAIETALAAGTAEVRLTHARAGARLQARDFDRQLKKALLDADTIRKVEAVLGSAEAQSTRLVSELDGQLKDIIAEMATVSALKVRIPEAEEYANEIRAAQAHAIEIAASGAELAAAGAQARLGVKSVKDNML